MPKRNPEFKAIAPYVTIDHGQRYFMRRSPAGMSPAVFKVRIKASTDKGIRDEASALLAQHNADIALFQRDAAAYRLALQARKAAPLLAQLAPAPADDEAMARALGLIAQLVKIAPAHGTAWLGRTMLAQTMPALAAPEEGATDELEAFRAMRDRAAVRADVAAKLARVESILPAAPSTTDERPCIMVTVDRMIVAEGGDLGAKRTDTLRRAVRMFVACVGSDIAVADITGGHVGAFLDSLRVGKSLRTGKLSENSQRTYFLAVRKFLNWCAKRDMFGRDIPAPGSKLDAPEAQDGNDRALTLGEFSAIYGAAVARFGADAPQTMQLAIAWYCGARRAEVAQLRGCDVVSFGDGRLALDINENDGKSLKEDCTARVVPVPAVLTDALRTFVAARAALAGARAWLFTVKAGEGANRIGERATETFDALRAKLGLSPDALLKGCRTAYVQQLVRVGCPRDERLALLGHAPEGGRKVQDKNYVQDARIGIELLAPWADRIEPVTL